MIVNNEHKAVSFRHRTVRKRLVALDVGYPDTVRTMGGEVTTYQVRGRCLLGIRPGGRNPPSAVNALDTGLAHETGHPFAAHSHTLGH